MGSLRRKVSVHNISLQPPKQVEAKREEAKKLDMVDWSQLALVDCGCCTLSLKQGDTNLSGIAVLEIRMRSCRAFRIKQVILDWLLPVLLRVLNMNIDFVIRYDFRDQRPTPSFAQGLAAFIDDNAEQFAERLKSAVVLIEDTIFVAAAQGLVGSFIKACLPGCPCLICHGEAAAQEFFRTSVGSTSVELNPTTVPFVSVAGVKEAPLRPSRDDSLAMPAYLASLKPLQPNLDTIGSTTDAGNGCHAEASHTVHMLPNGDVRVIQSPPHDLVIRASSPDCPTDETSKDEQPKDEEVKPLASGIFSATDLSAVAALKFECSRDQLDKLVGAHFHMGEIMIDAEIESYTHQARALSGTFKDLGVMGCLKGIQLTMLTMMAQLLGEQHLNSAIIAKPAR